MRFILLALLTGIFLLPACRQEAPAPEAPRNEEKIPFRKDGVLEIVRDGEPVVEVDIEIAATDSARQRGMMQRTGFPTETSGMLFVFEREAPQSFWMANTPVALDLFFIDADSQIVDISRYARPFSPESIASEAPARFVLEVPAGFADRHGITELDRIRF